MGELEEGEPEANPGRMGCEEGEEDRGCAEGSDLVVGTS